MHTQLNGLANVSDAVTLVLVNETLRDILRWLGLALIFGLLVWIQRKLFGPRNK